MEKIGPQLETLTHRLAECPGDFYTAPLEIGPGPPKQAGAVDLLAIVSDHFRDLGIEPADVKSVLSKISAAKPAQQRLVAIAIWLLHDEWFLSQKELREGIGRLLTDGLRPLAETVKPETTVTDADRREELARLCLSELGFRPAGETIDQATDRLNTLDSVERVRVVKKTRKAEARARKIREEMARRRAAEAAARYSPE